MSAAGATEGAMRSKRKRARSAAGYEDGDDCDSRYGVSEHDPKCARRLYRDFELRLLAGGTGAASAAGTGDAAATGGGGWT
jgi:hypothetical protein